MSRSKVRKLQVVVGQVFKVGAIVLLVSSLLTACKKMCSPAPSKAKSPESQTATNTTKMNTTAAKNPSYAKTKNPCTAK